MFGKTIFMAASTAALLASAPAFAADFSNPTLIPINDGITSTSSITVAPGAVPGGNVTGVSVTLHNFNHTWLGDLRAFLSNGITTVDLFNFQGTGLGPAADANGTYTFTDSALLLSSDMVTHQGGGSFRPFQSLSAFNGAPTAGIWTLSVSDDQGGDSGSVRSGWTLSLTGATDGAVPEPATWMMMILGFAAIGGAMRSRRKVSVSYA